MMGAEMAVHVTLGIDPGTALVGYAVVRAEGDHLALVVASALTTSPALPLPRRLQHIYYGLRELIQVYSPDDVAMEQLFFARNTTTAIAVGQARGVALLAAAEEQRKVYEYTPLQIKQAVHGYGRATKEQVGEMVRVLLQLSSVPAPDDAADAAAIAICHLHSAAYHQLIQANH
jgi:crossover junction endodeoxyribonuclease RuvC